MKKLLLFIVPLLILSCVEETQELNVAAPESAAEVDDLSMNGFLQSVDEIPKIRFRKKKNGGYRLIIKDERVDTTGTMSFSLRCCPESISLTFAKIETTYSVKQSIPSPPSGGYENEVVDFAFKYFDADGNPTGEKQFSVFVNEEGKTTLQEPALAENAISGTIIGDELKISVFGIGDPADQVVSAVLKARFSDENGKQWEQQINLKEKELIDGNRKHAFIMSGTTKLQNANSDPSETMTITASIDITYVNAKGQKIADFEGNAKVFADFRGRIKRVRIRERNNGADYNMVVVTDDGNPAVVDYVRLQFNEPFEGPTPNETVIKLTQPTVNKKDENRWLWTRPKSESSIFNQDAVGATYSVTATLVDKKGEPLGEPFSTEVMVEDFVPKEERPVIEDFRIFSFDDGKTWNLEARIIDRGSWVDEVSVRFVDSDKDVCMSPIRGRLEMIQTGEGEGKLEVYSIEGLEMPTINLECNYSVVFRLLSYGRGTRGTASSADNRAELL